MTNEEIKKIANKIARSFVHPDDYAPYGEQVYRQVEAVITQLSKDYCIVPKSQLKELYDCYRQHEHTCKAKGLHNATLIAIGSQATMCDIFGSSLFEEDKK